MAKKKQTKPSKTPTPKSKDKYKQTNNQRLLASIPTTSINRAIQCAKERKSMLFVGGNKDQRNILAKQIHSICCRRLSKVGGRKIQRKSNDKISKLVTINCMYYEDIQEFHGDINDIKKSLFISRNYLKAEVYQMINQGDLVPTSVFENERENTISIETLFIDNLDSLSPDNGLLRKVARLADYKFRSFKPLIIVSVNSSEKLHSWFRKPFEEIPLSPEQKAEVGQQEGKVSQKKTEGQEIISLETTLSYNKTTGKFRYEDSESIPISKTSRHKVRNMAEKLMKWWKKGKPCPQHEIVKDPKKKTPASIYDNTTTIRNTLKKHLKVNMPQCANDEYPPPSEPKHFNIVS